ncbi:alpha-amylase family glycosyl hydrolase [Companilactobacillus allii]|uniref:Alpha-amylase n=1 Tax=Companilactobacillus allii TaxID=1847728 RepID=A0A1P8Q4M7_9LACO|nr:alpha-amylase family glycosyl hydrolase [Companilactobacillus allii]APX72749.1 alpha-amylase [Companilactobacillus allii]USQ67536.1 alpha-amylase family glycosyl hydrolase [Companilactobacillus allii]
MADDTSVKLRTKQLYCIFVRNHTKEGTLRALVSDLDRIKNLGTDYIWLLPINPIGEVDRKGTLGSPYSIKDYRKIEPTLGTWDDFEYLAKEIHDRDMKLMIDIVYNHTSRDSVLLKTHPEWFLRDDSGKLFPKNPDWSDVAELDYDNKDLWEYQIETLKQYAKVVDGFRCDVAPQVPIKFWEQARQSVSEVKENILWLAETTGGDYIKVQRDKGFWMSTDSESYRAFDYAYDYDIDQTWHDYINGKTELKTYTNALNNQELIYPNNYIKMRALENHDNDRAHKLFTNENDLINWLAFSEFQKGSSLIYAGQEFGMSHKPDLFEMDKLNWDKHELELSDLIKRMHELSQDSIQYMGAYQVTPESNDLVKVSFEQSSHIRVGIFTLRGNCGHVRVDLPDGEYTNLLDNKPVTVYRGIVEIEYGPVIIEGNV